MNPTALRLPSRATKPRRNGLTMVIDGGITQQLFFRLEAHNVHFPFAMPLPRQSRHQRIGRQSGLRLAQCDGLFEVESDGIPPQHHNIVFV